MGAYGVSAYMAVNTVQGNYLYARLQEEHIFGVWDGVNASNSRKCTQFSTLLPGRAIKQNTHHHVVAEGKFRFRSRKLHSTFHLVVRSVITYRMVYKLSKSDQNSRKYSSFSQK